MNPVSIMSYPASQGALAVWLELWRTLWLDLPLAWLDHVDRTAAALATPGTKATLLQAAALGISCEPSPDEAMDA